MAGPRVLVVDDSWTDLTLMATALRQGGYDVLTASDGEAALTMVETQRPDCIVLDIVLPHQNGFQVCRHIKQTAHTSDIPVILVSVKDTSLDQRWGFQQGASLYLIKPFEPKELVRSVQSVL
ncbi:MAG TPA: response regulator [Ktedonobacterales bacterium]